MDLIGFKKAITKSVVKNVIVGTGIFLFGVFIVWLDLSGADSKSDEIGTAGHVILWILALLCLFFGFFITYQHIKDHSRVKTGNHPVVNAIEREDKDYIVWIYENINRVEGGGSDHQIWAFDQFGKQFVLSLKAKRVQEVMKYLKTQFPNATLGFTHEIEAQMNQQFKAKDPME